MKENMDREFIQRLENLIIPRLEAIVNSGDGATIHRANELIFNITGWNRLSKERGDGIAELVTWREYIRTAEILMVQLAGGTSKDYWNSVTGGAR